MNEQFDAIRDDIRYAILTPHQAKIVAEAMGQLVKVGLDSNLQLTFSFEANGIVLRVDTLTTPSLVECYDSVETLSKTYPPDFGFGSQLPEKESLSP